MSGETKAPPKQPAPGIGATVGYPSDHTRIYEPVDPDAPNTVKFTLNGREVLGREGETIIEVCEREGLYVPHYCWHPSLSVAGNCRLCLVQVEKVPKPVIGCQTHIMKDMVVNTESAVAKDCREGMMEFLLVNHPLDCPICDRGGECQLQRYSMEYGLDGTRMADRKRKFIKPQADPLIDIERNRCIMCTRCVRFCDEVGGEHVMGTFDRGNGTYIGTFGQGPVSNIFSGNVIDLCPVGCLTSKPFRFKARPWELHQTQSTCTLCSSGCKVTYWTRNNRLYRTTPPSRHRHDHFTINEDTVEFICNQGRFANDYGQNEARADENQIRIAGRLAPTSFADAIANAAEGLREVIRKHGPESVAVLVSPRASMEEGLLTRKLAKDVIGTSSVDWRTEYASRAAADAVSLALSHADGDLEQHPDVIVVVNGSTVTQSPVLALRIQELARRYDRPLVLIGHHTESYLAAHADTILLCAAGETPALLKALGQHLSGEGNLGAVASLARAEKGNLDALKTLLSGVKRGLLVHNLEDYAAANAPAEVPAAIALSQALGEAWGYLPVVHARNAVGLHAVGCEPATGKGVAAPDLLAKIQDGTIKALFTLGSETLAGLRQNKGLLAALDKLEFFATADFFRSDINDRADAFLALATSIESTGVYADIEGNLALLKQAVDPQGSSHHGANILTALGRAMGAANFGANNPEQAWELVRGELAPASGVTLNHLELEGSSNDASFHSVGLRGGARTRAKKFNPGNYREDGLHLRGQDPVNGKLKTSDETAPAFSAPQGEGLVLVWGRHVSGRGYVNDRAAIADILLPKPWVELHPEDAARLDVVSDQFAVLEAKGQRAKVGIKVSAAVAPGHAYVNSGTAGSFDAGLFAEPVRVTIKGLDEHVPDQGEALTEAVTGYGYQVE